MKPLKNYWVCVSKTGLVCGFSIAYSKADSIEFFLQTSAIEWKEAVREYGWRCVKVNITFEEVKK